ncbi:phage holin family protein [Novosphingobium sp. MMS21-SN21R]|uniref:phage holin family protein n=1 Tax=Novosphingobium sp. MMS21-SN21R TaxID=2969298 RepID=UPI002887A277|nr:phage holin family protein [Novosphingobium sp. MMS21-SN21R]MDT0507853.1 phage holin family protein [Novosphingobium sp. MMS21-SN21R]
MTDNHSDAVTADRPEQPSIGDALRALVEDGQTLVEAEIAYRKAQAAYGLGEAKAIAILLVLGLAFGFFTLLAIVVGLLMGLAAYVGVWGALAIVGGALLLLTGLCLYLASARMSRVKAGIGGGSEPK